ncbi:MAG: DMT family transporter [Chloroflexi bacterium]|nr:DMT family transporter [Chloroflexota bacterium]
MAWGVAAGLLCAFCWAVGSVSFRNIAHKLDPFSLNAPRTLAAGLLMLIMLALSGHMGEIATIPPRNLFYLIISIAVTAAIGDAFYVTSIRKMGLSRTIPIANAYPALTMGLAVLFLNETITWTLAVGLVLVMIGVVLVSRPNGGTAADKGELKAGLSYALITALFWAAGMVLTAPGMEGIGALAASAVRTPALSLMLWAVVLVRRSYRQYAALTRREWVILIVGGLIGWGFGNLFFVAAVSLLGATRAAILASTPPIFALPLSTFWMHERPTWPVIVGTFIVVSGIILIS